MLIAGNIGGVNLGYTDNGVANLTTYFYVVTANGNGASPNSVEVSAPPTAIVTGLTATASTGQIVLNWNGTPGANYNVKRSAVTGGPYTTIATNLGADQLHGHHRQRLPDLLLRGYDHQQWQ